MPAITEEQFIEAYNEHAPAIFKYCFFRVSSKEDAEDIASQTFTKTWDYISQGKNIDQIKPFLYRIAHNAIIDFYKQRNKKQEKEVSINMDDGDTIDIPDKSSIVEDLDLQKTIDDVQDKIKDLNDNYREIITLRYINDLSMKEIAEVTGLSEGNVGVRLHRATEKLKKQLPAPVLTANTNYQY
jgi:RNA polymerase sigma-70 factor, ECF subfamily